MTNPHTEERGGGAIGAGRMGILEHRLQYLEKELEALRTWKARHHDSMELMLDRRNQWRTMWWRVGGSVMIAIAVGLLALAKKVWDLALLMAP